MLFTGVNVFTLIQAAGKPCKIFRGSKLPFQPRRRNFKRVLTSRNHILNIQQRPKIRSKCGTILMRNTRKQFHRNALRQILYFTSGSSLCKPLPFPRILLQKNSQRPRLPAAAKLYIHNFQMVRRGNPLRQRPNFIHL